MTRYVIVAESGADIPQDLVERYGIYTAPMHLIVGEKVFDDGEFSAEDVFSYFEKTGELPKTSGSTPADFSRVFDDIHAADPDAQIIHLAYSAVTTCSYESALTASEGREYVHHFDTKGVSAGQGLVVLAAAEYIAANPDAGIDQIEEVIHDHISRQRMAFMPNDLRYLRAGGRLSNVAFIGTQLLRVRPHIEILDGKLVATKLHRGTMLKAARKMLEDFLKKFSLDQHRLFLLASSGLSPEMKEMAEEMIERVACRQVIWAQTGCVVSSHGGPGAFGIAALTAR